jgi:uncharacterized Zn finger protein
MCKHVAAVLYGVGARLDHAPEMLFALRGVDPAEMVADAVGQAPTRRGTGRGRVLAADDLSSVFGVDIEMGEAKAGAARAERKPRPVRRRRGTGARKGSGRKISRRKVSRKKGSRKKISRKKGSRKKGSRKKVSRKKAAVGTKVAKSAARKQAVKKAGRKSAAVRKKATASQATTAPAKKRASRRRPAKGRSTRDLHS